jgi:hypothetical protein
MTNEEVGYILSGIEEVANNYLSWKQYYRYNEQSNEYEFNSYPCDEESKVEQWYNSPLG